MNKNGFTLVELLGVITILAIVTVLASFSVTGVTNLIKKSMWENKVNLIENGAVSFGEQNNYLLKMTEETCTIDGKNYPNCIKIDVGYLIDRGFVSTDERDNDKKVIKNNITEEIVNNKDVYVWMEHNIIYAKYAG